MNDVLTPIESWITSWNWGDVPTWVLATVTPFSILVGFLVANKQLRQNAKIEEQKFFLKIDEIFVRDDNEAVRDLINEEIDNSVKIDITNSVITKKIDNYLNHLEFICNIYQMKIISKQMVDSFVVLRISRARQCTSIIQYIKNERIRIKENRLWEAIEQVDDEFKIKPKNKFLRKIKIKSTKSAN